MATTLNATTRLQPSSTSFPARRSSHRNAGVTSSLVRPLVRRPGRHRIAVPGDPSIAFSGHEAQAANQAIDGPGGFALPDDFAFHAMRGIDAVPSGDSPLSPLLAAALDDEDEDAELDDDDVLDDEEEEDEDLDEEDEDEEDDEEEDDYEDLDDEDEDEDEDDDDEDDE